VGAARYDERLLEGRSSVASGRSPSRIMVQRLRATYSIRKPSSSAGQEQRVKARTIQLTDREPLTLSAPSWARSR